MEYVTAWITIKLQIVKGKMQKNSQKPNFLFSFLSPRNVAKFLASLFPRNTEFHFIKISIESPHCLTFLQGIFVGTLIFVYFNAFNFLRFELCFRLRFARPLCVCLSLSLARMHTHTHTHTYTNTSLQLLLVCPAGGQQIALAFHVCVCFGSSFAFVFVFPSALLLYLPAALDNAKYSQSAWGTAAGHASAPPPRWHREPAAATPCKVYHVHQKKCQRFNVLLLIVFPVAGCRLKAWPRPTID